MSAQFPAAIVTQLKTAVNNLTFSLSAAVGIADPIIYTTSTTGAPAAGSFHIGNEVIYYTGKAADRFTGCLKGQDGTVDAVHNTVAGGNEVVFGPEAHHINNLNEEMVAVQTALGAAMANVILADGTIPLTADWDVGAFKITGTQFVSDIAIGTAPLVVTSTTVVNNLNADTIDGIEGASLAANEIIIMANGFIIAGSACALVEANSTAAKCYTKHLAVAKTEWFDVPKFRVPDTYDGGDIVINVCFRSAGESKTHSLGIRVASVATTEPHNPDLAAAYQLYNAEASDATIGDVKIKTVTVTQANSLMVAGEIWHCKCVVEDDGECDADDVLIDFVVIEWNKG